MKSQERKSIRDFIAYITRRCVNLGSWNRICIVSMLFSSAAANAQTLRNDISLSDPAVMADPVSKTYYMTGTGGDVYRSTDLEVWEKMPWAINTSGISWIGAEYTAPAPGQIWAPELYCMNGAYYDVVTFTNPDSHTEGTNHSRRSIHILKSSRPEGPYSRIDGSDELYLPASKMAIDGTIWEEDGKLYLVYCYEWVQAGDGAIEYIELKPDLTGTVGEPRTICRASDGRAWNTSSVTDGPYIFRTQTGRLGMIWTSWRGDVYVQGVSYSDNGRLDGKWTHEPMPITPDNHGHGMLFRTFDGRLLMSIHSNRTIDSANQIFERHPVFFVMDDSDDELRAIMQYRPVYDVRHPADVVVRNAGFDYSTNGWTCVSDAVNQGIASNQGGTVTGNYFECWDGSSFTGEIFQDIELPNGTYRLTASAFRSFPAGGFGEDDGAVRLFAGGEECSVTSDTPENYSVTVYVSDGHLRFGIKAVRKNYQWMGIDNVKLVYYGEDEVSTEEIDRIEEDGGDAVYIMHSLTGKYISSGGSWGTRAMLDQHALDLYLVELPDGRYAVDSKIRNSSTDHYLGSNGYLDSQLAAFQIEQVDSGIYTLAIDNKLYVGAGTSSDIVSTEYSNGSLPFTKWMLKSRKDMIEELRRADFDNPVDATFLVRGAGFGRNDTRVSLYWNGSFSTGGDVTNQCAETSSETFNIYQDLKDLPNGTYELRAQGFTTAGEGKVVFYAGARETSVMPASGDRNGSVPSSLDDASKAFTAGRYVHRLTTEVTDGHMKIGIRTAQGSMPAGVWTVFDNFELYYLGDVMSSSITDASDEPDDSVQADGVYDLSGRKIAASINDSGSLRRGIYIIGGKKVVLGL